MAENKKTVVVYTDWMSTFEKLTDDEAGKLIKHMFRYVNDLHPQAPDRLTELVFEPIKSILKRDLKKWEITSAERSATGRLGGIKSGEARALKAKQNEANASKIKQLLENRSKTKQNEHDIDIDIDIEREKKENNIPTPKIKKIISQNEEKEIKPVFREISADIRWLEAITMNCQLKKIDKTLDYLEEFMKKLECEGKEYKSINDTKSHFYNWLNLKLNHAKQY